MPERELEREIRRMLSETIEIGIRTKNLERLLKVVEGIIQAGSIVPSKIASSLRELGLSEATEASIERQIRRFENDPSITPEVCFHPFARRHLMLGRPRELLLAIDPTTQDERVVILMVSVWYRGCALPLGWTLWPGNQPLKGDGFWARVEQLMDEVSVLLPVRVPVTILGDRAFGTPAFTDLAVQRGWDYVVRIQGQTRYREWQGEEREARTLVSAPSQRRKLRTYAFKKRGWRPVSLVAYWGVRHSEPLLIVSSLRPSWQLLKLYKRRFPIDSLFRDLKSDGWHFEQEQVTDLEHLERLITAMALAIWLTLLAGTAQASSILARKPTGNRRTRPYDAKFSLFEHGLRLLRRSFRRFSPFSWALDLLSALNWSAQLSFLHRRAFIFSC
ncbi:transposase [Chloroflexi bacterium TSY]|nr:transposase [Chloroflexi bacterium TSY]